MNRSEIASSRLETLQRVFLFYALLYLALHGWVSFEAYARHGFLAGLATLLTLGFGDLYWAVTWGFADPGAGYVGTGAVAAAAMAFLSWGMRGYVDSYLMRLGAEAIGEALNRIEDSQNGTDTDTASRETEPDNDDIPRERR